MIDQHQNFRDGILKRRARIEEINLILAQPIPPGSHPTPLSRRRLIEQRLRIEQAVEELEREDARLFGAPPTLTHPDNGIALPILELLHLPSEVQGSGDPIDGNPFSLSDPRHNVWKDATRIAEEQWCRLNSAPENQTDKSPEALIHSVCNHAAAKFDVWAKRGVYVVRGDEAARAYDQWLINYAEAWLQDVSKKNLYGRIIPIDNLLAALRLILTKRVNWWKAEARKYLAELRLESTKDVTPAPDPTSGSRRNPRPGDASPDTKLSDAAKFPTMTVAEVTSLLHISRSSVYRYLDEGRLKRPGLNKKLGKRSKTLILTTSVKEMLRESEE